MYKTQIVLRTFLASVCSILVFGCSKDESEITTNKSSSLRLGEEIPECPENYRLVKHIDFDGVNFRTRKSDCNSGFGLFCLVNKEVRYECVSTLTGQPLPEVIEEPGKGLRTSVIFIQEDNNSVKIHFPKELQNYSPNGNSDCDELDIEEDYLVDSKLTLKQGLYPVTRTTNEYIVVVDTH